MFWGVDNFFLLKVCWKAQTEYVQVWSLAKVTPASLVFLHSLKQQGQWKWYSLKAVVLLVITNLWKKLPCLHWWLDDFRVTLGFNLGFQPHQIIYFCLVIYCLAAYHWSESAKHSLLCLVYALQYYLDHIAVIRPRSIVHLSQRICTGIFPV